MAARSAASVCANAECHLSHPSVLCPTARIDPCWRRSPPPALSAWKRHDLVSPPWTRLPLAHSPLHAAFFSLTWAAALSLTHSLLHLHRGQLTVHALPHPSPLPHQTRVPAVLSCVFSLAAFSFFAPSPALFRCGCVFVCGLLLLLLLPYPPRLVAVLAIVLSRPRPHCVLLVSL